MIQKLFISSLLILTLSACVHSGHHHGKKINKTKPHKASRVLDQEHQNGTIIIVTRIPAKGRRCWGHKSHWHCQR